MNKNATHVRILALREWRHLRGKTSYSATILYDKKMEGVDLYGDLDDPFFFPDPASSPPDQVRQTR